MIWASDIMKAALANQGENWAEARAELAQIYDLRNGTPKEVEVARKRLLHPNFKTTNISDSMISLGRVSHKIKEKLARSMKETMTLLIEDIINDQEIQSLSEARKENEKKTRAWHQTGLHRGARVAFEYLYENHQITANQWQHIPESDLDEIAGFVKAILNKPGSRQNPINLKKAK